jgi:phosphoglucomutase
VSFGTSGHRGNAFESSFNEDHIICITQAICEYRQQDGTTGPLFLAQDTHALSEPAFAAALEVLAANAVETMVDQELAYTPTPALSQAILAYNKGRKKENGLADGIVITPSHNPPEDGGFKYNPPNGGPADTSTTKWIENRANELLAGLRAGSTSTIRRVPYATALAASTTHRHDYITNYVDELQHVIDFGALSGTKLVLAVDPLGGAGVHYWPRIADRYGIPFVFQVCSYLPLIGLLTALLPSLEKPRN